MNMKKGVSYRGSLEVKGDTRTLHAGAVEIIIVIKADTEFDVRWGKVPAGLQDCHLLKSGYHTGHRSSRLEGQLHLGKYNEPIINRTVLMEKKTK